ncbi:uncharacterized protein boss isoform X2 [Venturia canescens]|nr:uncharacterized protein LOC122405811 isoform X2 [Venturia canescens]
MCTGNHTLLDAPGDAVISVFVNANTGFHCNETTTRGFEEISTALYVVQMLNKYDYVPGLSLGLKIFDTCHNSMTVYKQALMEAVAFDCLDYYELGVLVPSIYSSILKPLGDYNMLPISVYKDANMTSALLDTMIQFISSKFEVVDLLLIDSLELLSRVLDASKEAGICVKSVNEFAAMNNRTETETVVVVVVGSDESIRSWIKRDSLFLRKTWIVLPINGSYSDGITPSGSYIIRSESFYFDLLQEFPSVDDFLDTSEYPVIHSPHLLSVGKSIIQIAQVLVDLQRRTCPHGEACVLPRFNSKSIRDISNTEIYEALHILPKSHIVKYEISQRTNDLDTEEFARVATYNVNVTNLRVTPEIPEKKMPKLCVNKLTNKCQKCVNFKVRVNALAKTSKAAEDITSTNNYLKEGVLVPIFLTVMGCGTFASLVIVIFIVHRYLREPVLEGNPSLTVLLVIANTFVLQTILPFCMNDRSNDMREYLNSRKIFFSTLSYGMTFSIMLSRAFFLAFSTGGVFTSHINGYLQGLMLFFMAGVQVAISTMYFLLSTADSSKIVRSLTFVALLGYNIFLLLVLFVVCCFVAQIQRNYREGKCFFGTAIGLVIAWAVWLTSFALVEINLRDMVVSSGIIATGYIIIIGILIPRTYYMLTHLVGGKDFFRRYETTDLGPDPRTSTIARQSVPRPLYDYVYPIEDITGGQLPQILRYPNYYGGSSPNPHYRMAAIGRDFFNDPVRLPAYNNYEYRPDMQETENPYVMPRICLENPEGSRVPIGRDSNNEMCYAQPRCPGRPKFVFRNHKDCIETDVYVEDRKLSPDRRGPNEVYPSRSVSPRLYQSEDTIREEEEQDRDATRITRL